MPASELVVHVGAHAGDCNGGGCATEAERIEESGAGVGVSEGGVRRGPLAIEIVPAPAVVGEALEFGAPSDGEAAAVVLVAKFAAGGGADVMKNDAAEGDGVDAAGGAGAEAEVDVFAAVVKAFVEAAEVVPERTGNERAGAGDGGDAAGAEKEAEPARREPGAVLGFGFEVDDDAGVVDGAGGHGALDVADHAGARAEPAVEREHGLEPAAGEDEVAVEEDEEFPAGEGRAAVVGAGVAQIAVVEDHADFGRG